MRIFFLVIIFSGIWHCKLNAQLKYLFSEDFKTVDNVGDVFEKYNFAISYKNRLQNLKSRDGKKYYFKPDRSVYYEVFEDKYLLISSLDSIIIKKALPTAPFFYPRNKVYLLLIRKLCKEKMYFINFDGKIIIENASLTSLDTECYLLEKIDLKKMKLYIYNSLKKIRQELEIHEEIKL